MATNLPHANRSIDIITIGCEEQVQRRNVLKGVALQKLVKHVMKRSEEDISLQKIFDNLSEQQSEYFIVKKLFRTQSNRICKQWKFLHISDFEDYLEIRVREQVISKKWKSCSYCGQKIKAAEQYSRKCWKCKKGWYRSINKREDRWTLYCRGEKSRVIQRLLKEGYLKLASLRKRLDFFHYSKGEFIIFEAKNKEKTGLTVKDVQKTLIYPYIVSRCGYEVRKLYLIFNGKITQRLVKALHRGLGSELPFSIELLPISLFLTRNNVTIKAIKVTKENNQYEYQLLPGLARKLVIDLTAVERMK